MNTSNSPNESHESDLDRATADRLAKLRTLPVDTSRLDVVLRAQIPAPEKSRLSVVLQIGPMRAIAASIVVLATIAAIFIMTSGGPALASPMQMAQMHADLVAGRTPVMKVDSIAAANRALAAQSPQSPTLPDVPPDHVMACCMKSVANKKVACVLLRSEGIPVTMTVANAKDMKLPTAPTVTRDGVTYRVQASGKINMVMTERNDRWICLVSELQADQLMELASKLQF